MSPPIPSFDDTHEREWQAQEHAMEADRLGLDPSRDDSRVKHYRVLARMLRQPLPARLPDDFAQQVAAQVASQPTTTASAGSHLESILLVTLSGILLMAAGVVLAHDVQPSLAAIRAMLPFTSPHDLRWPLTFAACLGLSWLLSSVPGTTRS